MAKQLSFRRGWSSVLLWSILSAAFIGPGTVTTAAQAGATYGLQLLWALVFATVATIFLQEMVARLTIATGQSLGQLLAQRYQGYWASWIKPGLFGAIGLGCAAYEAGNFLGAIQGLRLLWGPSIPAAWLTLGLGACCVVVLWRGSFNLLSGVLSAMVAAMGLAFIYVAIQQPLGLVAWGRNILWPVFPPGSGVLVIGLVGTTIVPYNFFLGSGLGQEQSIPEMRWGIALAVGIGGIISMAILAGGIGVVGPFSYPALIDSLRRVLGPSAPALFSLGLFAAGLSSAITAPLAAAVTGQGLYGGGAKKPKDAWSNHGWGFRLTWLGVLAIGVGFGWAEVRPIPAIVAAQAVNGLLLPVVTVFLLLAANDATLIGETYANTWRSNGPGLVVVGVTTFLGLNSIWAAWCKALGWSGGLGAGTWEAMAGIALGGMFFLARKIRW